MLCARLGGRVSIADFDRRAGLAAAQRIRAAGREATPFECDATDQHSVREMVHGALERYKRVDALLTFVGGAHPAPLLELDLDSWNAEIRFNLTSAFLTCREVLPHMAEQGSGAIVVTSSGFGTQPQAGRAAYSAAKAGVIGFARTLAAEVGPLGVRVNVVSPGATETERFTGMVPVEEVEHWRSVTPTGRLNRPYDCAAAAVFLISDQAAQLTGQVLHVNGGQYMP